MGLLDCLPCFKPQDDLNLALVVTHKAASVSARAPSTSGTSFAHVNRVTPHPNKSPFGILGSGKECTTSADNKSLDATFLARHSSITSAASRTGSKRFIDNVKLTLNNQKGRHVSNERPWSAIPAGERPSSALRRKNSLDGLQHAGRRSFRQKEAAPPKGRQLSAKRGEIRPNLSLQPARSCLKKGGSQLDAVAAYAAGRTTPTPTSTDGVLAMANASNGSAQMSPAGLPAGRLPPVTTSILSTPLPTLGFSPAGPRSASTSQVPHSPLGPELATPSQRPTTPLPEQQALAAGAAGGRRESASGNGGVSGNGSLQYAASAWPALPLGPASMPRSRPLPPVRSSSQQQQQPMQPAGAQPPGANAWRLDSQPGSPHAGGSTIASPMPAPPIRPPPPRLESFDTSSTGRHSPGGWGGDAARGAGQPRPLDVAPSPAGIAHPDQPLQWAARPLTSPTPPTPTPLPPARAGSRLQPLHKEAPEARAPGGGRRYATMSKDEIIATLPPGKSPVWYQLKIRELLAAESEQTYEDGLDGSLQRKYMSTTALPAPGTGLTSTPLVALSSTATAMVEGAA